MLRILLVSAIAVLPAVPAWAVDVTPSGFLVRHELAIGAPAARVYASLLDVGSWWSGKHTYSGESRNLSIDARAGGCFCEKLPSGAVEHMRVVFPGRTKCFARAGRWDRCRRTAWRVP